MTLWVEHLNILTLDGHRGSQGAQSTVTSFYSEQWERHVRVNNNIFSDQFPVVFFFFFFFFFRNLVAFYQTYQYEHKQPEHPWNSKNCCIKGTWIGPLPEQGWRHNVSFKDVCLFFFFFSLSGTLPAYTRTWRQLKWGSDVSRRTEVLHIVRPTIQLAEIWATKDSKIGKGDAKRYSGRLLWISWHCSRDM